MNLQTAPEFDQEEASAIAGPRSALDAARAQMFVDFCAALEAQGIRYVILAGHDAYPERIDSDVDFMVSDEDFQRLPKLFCSEGFLPQAQLIQVLRHETTACCYVFARQNGSRLCCLKMDASADYRRRGRLWMRSKAVLPSRRMSARGFWIPAAAVEFEYYLIKRLDKGQVGPAQLQVLAARFAEDPSACQAVLTRLLPPELADGAVQAIARRDTGWFANHERKLKAALSCAVSKEGVGERATAKLGELRRWLQRVRQPTGFVLAVLGPDGSGKTTVLEHLECEFAPAFPQLRRFHLRPRFGTGIGSAPCADPHGRAPRGWPASALKLLFFGVDYWSGWVRLVLPARVRSTLLIFDRYYHDMLVDPLRYRLPPRFGLARSFAGLIPKPDAWLVLHATPATLVARKRELDEATAHRLVDGYRALGARLERATAIDTDGALEPTLERAVSAVRLELERRARSRIGGAR